MKKEQGLPTMDSRNKHGLALEASDGEGGGSPQHPEREVLWGGR